MNDVITALQKENQRLRENLNKWIEEGDAINSAYREEMGTINNKPIPELVRALCRQLQGALRTARESIESERRLAHKIETAIVSLRGPIVVTPKMVSAACKIFTEQDKLQFEPLEDSLQRVLISFLNESTTR